MSALAEIVRGGVRYRLPLTPEAAVCLAGALAADDPGERLAWLARGVGQDPPLALWCAVQAPEPTLGMPWAPALCQWLASRLGDDLAQARPAAERAVSATKRIARELQLLARSRAVAQTVGNDSRAGANAALLGLLHRAIDWLVLSGAPRPKPQAVAEMLPEWLATPLARLKKPVDCPPESIEARVRAAIAATADGSCGQDAPGANDLAELLSQVASRVARHERLAADFDRALEQAKLEALKEFAYGAGHEINNPLANISARAQTLLKEESDPERRQKLAAINTQAFRAHEMIADLMLFARPPEMKPERIELAPFLDQLARSWQDHAAEQQTEIELRVAGDPSGPPPAVWADRSALAVALRALATNALEALGHGGRIEVAAAPARLERAGEVRGPGSAAAFAIRVRDNGPGIPAEIRGRLFDPYFSGREAGRGLGFGLCKCWRIVTAQGGRIDVASDVGAGATFTVTLPAAGAAAGG